MTLEIQIVLLFGLPAVISYIATPAVIRFATIIGAIDHPNERKIHQRPIPRLGGLAIFSSVGLSLLVLSFVHQYFPFSEWIFSHKGGLLFLSLLGVFLLGFVDDLRPLTPGKKFAVQVIAATMAYAAGFHVSSITSPLGSGILPLGILDYPATIIWIVGVSNAFNLIDGLDGLAAGVGIIASSTVFAISFMDGDLATAFPILCLAGALAGFLRYNFHPAKIFLGDSGSLFVGFFLAVMSVQSSTKGSTAFALLVPVLSLGLPIMDTLLSMVRRFLHALLPGEQTQSLVRKLYGMFLPDRKHIHHQLIALGFSHRNVVLILYSVSCLLGIGAFAVTVMNHTGASVLLISVAFATIAGIHQLHYKEMSILRNGLLLPMYEWPAMNRSLVQGFIDLAFCAAAITGAYYINAFSQDTETSGPRLISLLPFACGTQIGVFYFSGLYRGTYQYLGIGDLLKIVKSVVFATATTVVLVFIVPGRASVLTTNVIIIDFYLLLTLVAGSRASFHILNYLFRREGRRGPRLLIYGADVLGVLALQKILHDDSLNLAPVGFLDDKPLMRGKRINGYPVFGSHWNIPTIIKKQRVDQILLSCENIPAEVLNRLREFSKKYGFTIRRSRLLLEELPLERRTAHRHIPSDIGIDNVGSPPSRLEEPESLSENMVEQQ